jgi:hypothetical protein
MAVRTQQRVWALTFSLVAALLTSLLVVTPAGAAAPEAPSIDGANTVTNGAGDVVLAWSAVSGASSYKVDISTDSAFGSTLQPTITTQALRATPAIALPAGTVWWRVAAVSAGGTSGYAMSSFERTQVPGPSIVSPGVAGTATLHYPTDSPVLTWNPVGAAKDYTVEWSQDNGFPQGGTSAQTTAATSYAIPSLLSRGGTWYWRVRGNLTTTGLTTAWSSYGQFIIDWPSSAPTLNNPVNDPGGDTPVSDVELSWNPVPGAKSYNVYVSTDPGFSSLVSGPNPISVLGTRYSPARSWSNASYYWKVTAVDLATNEGPPSTTRQFTGSWGPTTAGTMSLGQRIAAPDVVSPTSGSTVSLDEFRLEWTNVPRASVYEVWLTAETSNFFTDNPKILKCYTPHTSITHLDAFQPLSAGQWVKFPSGSANANTACFGKLGTSPWTLGSTFRWRVRALDLSALDTASHQSPGNVDGLPRFIRSAWSDRDTSSNPASVTITSDHSSAIPGLTPTLLSPANCTDVATCVALPDTPELVWTPVVDATAGYWVEIALDSSFTNTVAEFRTEGARLRIDGGLLDNTASQAYYWRVMGCTSFTNFSTKSCLPNGSANIRAFRKSSASPVGLNATSSGDHVRFAWSWDEDLSADSDASRGGVRGFQVQAATDSLFSSIVFDESVDQPFVSTQEDFLQDGSYYWRVRALDGSAVHLPWSDSSTVAKSAGLPSQAKAADGATAPTLTWTGVPGTASYQVEVYNGDNLSVGGSRVLNPTGLVNPAYTPTSVLPPGTYSWRVRRVDAGLNVLPWSVEPGFVGATQTFTVTIPKCTLQSPADGGIVTPGQRLLTWTGASGAVKYRVQTSTSASFASTVESVDTVQTAYALAGTAYVPGTTYYWRVRPLNASGGVLSGSDDVRSFSIAANVPATPGSVKVAAGVQQLSVSWSKPADGGSPITGYVVRYTPAGGATATTTTASTSVTLTGLAAGVVYSVEVAALNAVGTGAFSSAVSGTPTAGTTPTPTPTAGTTATAVTIGGGKTILYGSGATLTGTLKTSSGTGLANKTVTVQVRPVGGSTWGKATTATTNSSGGWAAVVEPSKNREYRASFAAAAPHGASTSGTTTVFVKPKITRKLSDTTVKLGAKVTFSGKVRPAHKGKTVQLQRKQGTKWVTKKQATTSATSTYRFVWKTDSKTDYRWRVVLPKHGDHAKAISAKILLTVR